MQWITTANQKRDNEYLLCCVKSQLEIFLRIFAVQLAVVEGIRVEMVDKGTEGQTIIPARREVLYVNILQQPIDNKHIRLNIITNEKQYYCSQSKVSIELQ